MKKNMLTMLILVVSLANLIMTAIMLIVVVPSAKSYTSLVNKVAQAIDLEVKEETEGVIKVEDKEQFGYEEEDDLTINLKDDKFAIIKKIAFTLNKKDKNYEKTKTLLSENQTKIRDIVSSIYKEHTKEEIKNNGETIKAEVLQKLSEEFETEAILEMSFGSIVCQ